MTRWPAFFLLFALPLAAEEVRFETSDGVEIVADFHPVKKKAEAATVVCLPMFKHTRKTYDPLLQPLLSRGMNVLVLDKRGHGGSAPHLAGRVKDRDPDLFNAMHLDVEAAIEHLEGRLGCDATRIGLIGASVGCSVAVDTTVRHPKLVRAVVLLTPGSKYLEVPTLEHLRRWPGTRVFTFTAQDEEVVSKEVMDALAAHEGSNHLVVPGSRVHGTRMFGKVTSIEDLIANFMESSLVRSVDLRVPRLEKGDPRLEEPGLPPGPRRRIGGITYSSMVYAIGERWVLGGIVDGPFEGSLRIEAGEQTYEFPLDSALEGSAPIEAKGGKATGERGSAEGRRWVSVSLEGPADTIPLVVEFRPSKGAPIRLPGGGVRFRVTRPSSPEK